MSHIWGDIQIFVVLDPGSKNPYNYRYLQPNNITKPLMCVCVDLLKRRKTCTIRNLLNFPFTIMYDFKFSYSRVRLMLISTPLP